MAMPSGVSQPAFGLGEFADLDLEGEPATADLGVDLGAGLGRAQL